MADRHFLEQLTKRLAREHPGNSFYVLEPISVTKRLETETTHFNKIPF